MKKPVIIGLLALLAAVLLYFCATALYTRSAAAEAVMPEDTALYVLDAGGAEPKLRWTACENAEAYLAELWTAEGERFTAETREPELTIPADTAYTSLRITPLVGWRLGWISMEKKGTAFEGACSTLPATQRPVNWSINTETHILTASWKQGGAEGFLLRAEYAGGRSAETEVESPLRLDFSEGGCIPALNYGELCTLSIAPYTRTEHCQTTGEFTECFSLVRDDLYGTEMKLRLTAEEQNSYTFLWDTTKGERFTAVLTEENGAAVSRSFAWGETLTLTTEQLKPFTNYTLTATAEGDAGTLREECSFRTGAAARGCTVWPIKKMELYAEPDEESTLLGTVAEITALRVLEERDGFFKVETSLGECWLNASYCMINLPEYMGELCQYNITNSYKSLFKMHTFTIDKLTDEVLDGYENVRLEDGSFLVPLLYPTAQKLIGAAEAAQAAGYAIKIYDAYRPRLATYQMYNNASAIMNRALPTYNYYGNRVYGLPGPSEDYEYIRYYDLVTTEKGWSLGSFVARGGSFHNIGVAIDMTLTDLATGLDLEMQTEMHDLSIFSVLGRNNANAKLLAGFMKAAGFAPLSSEWWHFQDDANRKALHINWWTKPGVSPLGAELPYAEPIPTEKAA